MNKISKNDLLKLKASKPIPITAHTHEVVVPVVFASKVNEFLKKEGIKLPLTHHQLAEYKRKAAKVHGKIEEDDEEDEGNSHARGTHSIKVSNVKGPVYINTQPNKARRKRGKRAPSRKIITSASGLIPTPASMRIQPPPSNTIRPNYNTFAMIRPQGITYSANTPTLLDIQQELKAEQKKEKEVIEKREKELITQGEIQKKNIDSLTKALEAEKKKEQALIREDTRLIPPTSGGSSSTTDLGTVYSSSDEDESESDKEEEKPERNPGKEEVVSASAAASSAAASSSLDDSSSIPPLFSFDLLRKIRGQIKGFDAPATFDKKELYEQILARNPEILTYVENEYREMMPKNAKPGQLKKTHYKAALIKKLKEYLKQ